MRLPPPFCRRVLLGFLLLIIGAGTSTAADWPMWRYDAGHTAASPDDLPDRLQLQWTRQYSPRQTVWDDPLNQDMMPYDRIFEPVVADGRMLLGFNDSDKVVAIDVRDGAELWTFYAEGPVRFSPVVDGDAVFFCSDDGYLYCIGLSDGTLRWRFRGGPSERKVIGNRRVISSWPARGGPVVADNTVYFAASIWPFMGTFIYALDAHSGEVLWLNDGLGAQYQKQPHSAPSFAGVAPQGQLAVADDLLLVPGGRSLPAALKRASGELAFFNFGGKGQGGSFVASDGQRAFVHTRVRGTLALGLPSGDISGFGVTEPVLAEDVVYAASTADEKLATAGQPTIEAYGPDERKIWEIPVDGSGDLIKVGNRLYAAGSGTITAIQLGDNNEPGEVAWSIPVAGDVQRLLASSDRLFAVTREGSILAFGADDAPPKVLHASIRPREIASDAGARAEQLLATTGVREGYALWFGVDDGQLLRAVADAAPELHVVAVDPDASKIAHLRRELDAAGLYGRRVVLHVGTPDSFLAPPYFAQLVVIGRSLASELAASEELETVYQSVRPYGGKLWMDTGVDAERTEALTLSVAESGLERATVAVSGDGIGGNAIVVTRSGALPGAADWTHTYGDIANTVKSNDSRVKLPLGLLWFGGPSNSDILPRHGHGPSEQVVGGRLFIEGMNSLNAWDVYTGRILWQRKFDDLGTFQVYYDETYADTPLSTAYNQVHIPGANGRGTNYVATEDGVYLAVDDRCLLLDSATGETIREFVLPASSAGEPQTWGYIGVYEDLLLAGVNFADYSGRLGYEYTKVGKKGLAWGPDRTGSLGLLAFERSTGQIRWQLRAKHSFLHNGIVAGGGRVYLLDKLPKRVEEQNRRRGVEDAGTYRMLAVDADKGQPIWTCDQGVFGTWLGYSREHDLLLQACSAASDRSLDEADRGMVVHRAENGSVLWEKRELVYAGPCILHGDTIITNTKSYQESQGAFNLLDGSPITIEDPVTGQCVPWRFSRAYGCNTAVASENLLTFRSGAAGFYDLENHGGTGNFGGFKSGCTSNLIVANGVLNAPDYTRTCTCGYQNQTSLAMVPMPENELWTYNLHGRTAQGPLAVRRIGVNLGAPGDRLSPDGTLWVNHPVDDGSSPAIDVLLDGDLTWFRDHSGRITDATLPWVAASGVEGVRALTVRLRPQAGSESRLSLPILDAKDDAEESAKGAVSWTSSDLELTRDKTRQTVGLRFQKVLLKQGVQIKRAYVQFTVDEASDDPTQLEVRGQAADNAPPFSKAQHNITSRQTGNAVAQWAPAGWAKASDPGPDHRTPDLSEIIQEIVDRPGWEPGNALALMISGTGKRVASAADGGRQDAPRLFVEIAPTIDPATSAAAVQADAQRSFAVRMVFLEPRTEVKPGDRVFDVAIGGKTVTAGLDIAAEAGGMSRSVTRTWDGIQAADMLEITLTPHGQLPPILSGIEIIAE